MGDCRFCGTSKGVKINIFDSACDYVSKIETILPLKMESSETIPKVMCHRCMHKVNEFYQFRWKCLSLDLKWRERLIILENESTSTLVPPVLICGDLYGVSQPTVCRIIIEVSEVLTRQIGRYIRFPGNVNNMKAEFFQKSGFPGVIGAVDGTHIPIKSPGGGNAEIYRNRKGFFSINVQIVAGPQEEILDIVARWPGSAHDSRIFDSSAVRVRLSEGQLPGLLLGDSGYPQRHYIYTPVLQPHNIAQTRYNRAHKSTRSIVERAIGRWKRRFPCLYFELQNNVRNSIGIITACAVLHNIGIQANDMWEREEVEGGRDIIDVPAAPAADNLRGNVIRQNFIERHFQR